MKNFKVAEPQTIEQAVALLSKGGENTFLMSGGTDLIAEVKEGLVEPDIVIDLKTIPGLSYIKKEEDGVHIGILTAVADLAADPLIRGEYPVLQQAAQVVATPQIRNVGTVGGNLCQRPRCWYFRNSQIICRKKGGSQCYAFRGRNKYHAIFGGGMCFIVYPSDLAPALISLEAQAVINSPRGEKIIPLADFYALPSKNVRRENILSPDEILREVKIPLAREQDKSAYVKLEERGTWDFALVSAAVKGTVAGNGFSDMKIVLGGVAPVPWRMEKVENALNKKKLSEALIRDASRAALAEADPLEENGYKKQLAEAAISQAVLSLA
jgi:xanthine dehydrogenase YagS FAD-binding subunit